MESIERVHLEPGPLPIDYVGISKYAEKFAGSLIRADGSHYKRTDRRKYYASEEKVHPAKTPLHIARWAVQEFTPEDGWVLDPTMGVGTTAVEALRQGRNVVGMEIEFIDVIMANVKINNPLGKKYRIVHGDARTIADHVQDLEFDLVVNNSPYSGDVRQSAFSERNDGKWENHMVEYDPRYSNLAFLKENREYWDTLESVYRACADRLKPGGRFVIGVKDMMRNRTPFKLHEMIGDVLSKFLTYEMMTILLHHPSTLHLNTYEKKFGVKPPLYQTILVFKK